MRRSNKVSPTRPPKEADEPFHHRPLQEKVSVVWAWTATQILSAGVLVWLSGLNTSSGRRVGTIELLQWVILVSGLFFVAQSLIILRAADSDTTGGERARVAWQYGRDLPGRTRRAASALIASVVVNLTLVIDHGLLLQHIREALQIIGTILGASVILYFLRIRLSGR